MKNFKNILTTKRNNLGLFFQLTVFALFGIMGLFSGQTLAQQEVCAPTTTVTEGDLSPGGTVSFGVSSGPGSVTVDHINSGSGLQSFTMVSSSNAVVNIPAFTPGTFDPATLTFTVMNQNLPVDFRLRAASTSSAIFIRVRCACIPPLIITDDPSMFPGGPDSFEAITAGTGTITIDSINSGSGLQAFSMVSSSNVVVEMPTFEPGTFEPATANFTVINLNQSVEFTLRATNQFHGVLIKVLVTPCGSSFVTDDSPGSTDFFTVMPPTHIEPSGTIAVNTVNDATGLQSLSVMNAPNAAVNIPAFTAGTSDPVMITYNKTDPALPACMTLRAASNLHSIFFVLCSC
jgi:hypothetical protein